jgi:hypothetical protein
VTVYSSARVAARGETKTVCQITSIGNELSNQESRLCVLKRRLVPSSPDRGPDRQSGRLSMSRLPTHIGR